MENYILMIIYHFNTPRPRVDFLVQSDFEKLIFLQRQVAHDQTVIELLVGIIPEGSPSTRRKGNQVATFSVKPNRTAFLVTSHFRSNLDWARRLSPGEMVTTKLTVK